MKNLIFILLFVCFSIFTFGQDETKNKLGLLLGKDFSYNNSTNFLKNHFDHKTLLGLSFADKKNRILIFGGLGVKITRLDIGSPEFSDAFNKDVNENYFPIHSNEMDSIEAVGIYNNTTKSSGLLQYLRAIKSYQIQMGVLFPLHWKVKPFAQYYYGNEVLEFYNGALFYAEEFKGGDLTYSYISAKTHIVKLGLSIPFNKNREESIYLNFSFGYKYLSYEELSLGDLPFYKFTTGELSKKYNNQSNFIYSFSLIFTPYFLFF